MIRDPECTIFLGLSGARIPAGMQTLDPEGLNTGECPCGGEAGEPPQEHISKTACVTPPKFRFSTNIDPSNPVITTTLMTPRRQL
jgi:hypothetical protein